MPPLNNSQIQALAQELLIAEAQVLSIAPLHERYRGLSKIEAYRDQDIMME